MPRPEALRKMRPQLIADVLFYPTEQGGRRGPAYAGWGCPCSASRTSPWTGYDAWPLLDDDPINPGDRRRLGFVFLSDEGLETMRRAGRFFLWELGFVGEATVVEDWSSEVAE